MPRSKESRRVDVTKVKGIVPAVFKGIMFAPLGCVKLNCCVSGWWAHCPKRCWAEKRRGHGSLAFLGGLLRRFSQLEDWGELLEHVGR